MEGAEQYVLLPENIHNPGKDWRIAALFDYKLQICINLSSWFQGGFRWSSFTGAMP